jgi:hypothetical protein
MSKFCPLKTKNKRLFFVGMKISDFILQGWKKKNRILKSNFFKRKFTLENWLRIILKSKKRILDGAERNMGCKKKFSCFLLNSSYLGLTKNQVLSTFENCSLLSSFILGSVSICGVPKNFFYLRFSIQSEISKILKSVS